MNEKFISIEILPKLRDDPLYKPKAIQRHFKTEFRIEISYDKAYRTKQHALEHINDSHEDAYKYLPKYCEEIQRSNPGSTAVLKMDSEISQFKRMFLSFAASDLGFAYYHPILDLDGTHLKHKYQGSNICQMFLILGILLAVTVIDVNGQLFPLAHAVVDVENDDNWL